MKKVLFVEDNMQLQELYKDILDKDNYHITFVETGVKALEVMHTEQPDLVLLDIMIPGGMNGFDVLETIKRDEKLKDIPVIVCTNLDTERDTALSIGAVDYIVKVNTNPEKLLEKINKYLK